jgi:CheY-like chemotaxis protein
MPPMSKTILLADDEPSVRTYIRNLLIREGYEILEADDGLAALELAEGHAIDLLVTDVRMPRMNGVELARSLARKLPGTPVLFISGYPLDIEPERSHHVACGFVPKPFTRTALLDAIKKCLQPPHASGSHA